MTEQAATQQLKEDVVLTKEELQYKTMRDNWAPMVENTQLGSPIATEYKKYVVSQLLENTQNELNFIKKHGRSTSNEVLMNETLAVSTQAGNYTTGMDIMDPILINLVRRVAPNLMAYDMVGVQPMDKPTGTVFALRAFRGNQPQGPFGRPGDARSGFQTGSPVDTAGNTIDQEWAIAGVAPNEAFYNESPDTFSGTGTQSVNDGTVAYSAYTVGTAMSTTVGETLGRGLSGDGAFNQMAFTIEKQVVTAGLRALKATYTYELAQDLRAVHGLDAEKLLADILSTEILAETNREIINRIRYTAKVGRAEVLYSNGSPVLDTAGNPTTSLTGSFDVNNNSDGRWQAEKYKSLLYKVGVEANAIAKDTRRGKGNFIICSSDVATALDLAGKLIYSPAIDNQLPADDTGNTYVGMLQGRYKVFIDPYVLYDEIIVGYKGPNQMDAGFFYCPYVPLQLYKAMGEADFQPKMAMKTRYGILSNPFTNLNSSGNSYYRKFKVAGL